MKSFALALSALCFLSVSATAEEKPAADFKSILAIADKDNDGVITREEFVAARATLFPGFDADGSGDLSKDEFVKAMAGPAGSEFRARMAFGRVDANGDGKVTLEEWNAIPPRAFDKADKNKDGKLTSDEIEKA